MAPRPFTSIPTPPIEKIKPQNQESRVKGQIFPTWAVSEAKQILATHLAPLGPKIGSVSFPFANHIAKHQVLPYLFVRTLKMGVVVVEEAPLGRYHFHRRSHLGINAGL